MDTLFNRSSAISIVKKGKIKRMKSIFLLKIFSSVVILLMAIGFQKSYGQGVGISETSIVPHASSILELRYSSGPAKGFLAPRLTTVQRTGIGSPANGLLVYDTDYKSFWYYDAGWDEITTQTELDDIQAELDATQTGAGLNADGTYTANAAANYIDVATDLADADDLLDAQLKVVADSTGDIQDELDVTQTGAGLNADGTYAANGTANYIAGTTALNNADDLLDAQAKTNADDIATEVM